MYFLALTAVLFLAYAPLSDAKSAKDVEKDDVIEGHVTDVSTRKPIKGVVVEIKNANLGIGYYRLTTDSQGYYHISNFIKHMRYRIEATAKGYVTYVHTEKIQAGSYNIQLQKEGILSGVVKDSSGKTMEGVEVRLNYNIRRQSQEDDGEEQGDKVLRPLIVTTGKDGSYSFDKLKEGLCHITLKKDGYVTETARVDNVKSGEIVNLPMILYKPASLSGRILIDGARIPAIEINATLLGLFNYSATTNNDGTYSISDIKPGTYRFTLGHPGFHIFEIKALTIQEGQNIGNNDFSVTPKDASIEVYANHYTFVSGQPVAFDLKTLRIEKVKVRLYNVPVREMIHGTRDAAKADPMKKGFKLISQWEESIKNFFLYASLRQSLEIVRPLPPGSYCIEVTDGEKTTNRKYFSVTTIGIVVKRSQESIVVYATDLINNKPMANVSIMIYDKADLQNIQQTQLQKEEEIKAKSIAQGKTDKDGIYKYKIKKQGNLALLAIGGDGSYAFCDSGSINVHTKEKNKLFIYTDRPVYRAGDKVFYKIAGKSLAKKFLPMKGAVLYYQIRNIDAEKIIDSGEFALDDWGTCSNSITLGTDAGLGEYEIQAGITPDNLYASGKFYVEQYRKPEFKIDITPTKKFFINRDMLEFKVEAKYFFGSPLKQALVKYRFFETRLRDANTKYWWDEYSIVRSDAPGRLKLEGEKYLDANGTALLKLSAGNLPYDREITLEATIMDQSNASITSKSIVRVGRGEFYIKIDPDKQFFANNEKKGVQIKTVAHDGKPKSAVVYIKVYRYIWRGSRMVYIHDKQPLFEQKVSTDKEGRASIELPEKFDYYGEYDIVAESRDSQDNIINASRVVWVYGWGSARVDSRFKNLELTVSDTDLEKPGEITCLIKSRFADAYVLLSIEGRDIHETKVVKMNGNILPVKVNIKSEYAPNVFITATMQKNRALYTSSAGVALPNTDTLLSIAMKPDKERYLPGERVNLKISVFDEAGKPAATDLSLGVVDEAIYQIRPDHTPNMRDFFYSKISNWVLTNYSYTFTILAGAGKEGKVKIREKFADTAFWKADIRTDNKGEAALSFDMPDNLTTWRLTARGHDLAGRVGEKKSEVLVSQDLIARIGKPRFFTKGDMIGLIGIINNNTDRGFESVIAQFKANDKVAHPDEKKKISLPAYGSMRTFYTINVPEDKDSIPLFFQATADVNAKDALKITLPVYNSGADYTLYGTGDMSYYRTVELQPPRAEEFEFKPDELIITVNPSPVHKLLKASKFLSEYPYGCVEQTINKFLPVLALNSLLKQKGMKHLISDDNITDKATVGLKRVQDMQNNDGTWGWWSGDSGDGYLTGYALYALYIAKKLGYAVDEDRVKRGLEAVGKMIGVSAAVDNDQRAYLMYVSTLWGQWNKGFMNEAAVKANMNVYQLSFAIKALAEAKKLKDIDKKDIEVINRQMDGLVTTLKGMQKADGQGVYWSAPNEYCWSWQGGHAELTAHVFSALVESGDKSPLLTKIVNSLSKRGRGDGWRSTKETATILFAMCRYLEEIAAGISGKGNLSFTLNNNNIAFFQYDTLNLKDIMSLTKKVKIKKNADKPLFRIEAKGTAAADTSFDVTLKGNIYFKRGLFSIFRSEEKSMKSLDNGLSLARTYYAAKRVMDINNNEYFVPQEIATKMIKIGDEVLVKIKFKANDNYRYLVLEDFLPSGFEVVKQTIYDDYKPYSRIERWDDRVAFFFTEINKDRVYELAYTMRAELPGHFTVKPARMECMYEPSIQGWSSPGIFIVEKK